MALDVCNPLLGVDLVPASVQILGGAAELDEEEMPLPLVIEYLRIAPSPVFIHGATSLALTGSVTPEFSLMLAVYDFDGRPEKGALREIYDHLDKKKLAEIGR